MAKILVIEDSLMSRKMMRKILEENSHEVIEAIDGFSALEIFSLENPKLVMLDLTMPGMNGIEVLKKLKSINPDIKIIVATADIQSMTKDLALQVGADGYVTKPFVPAEVMELVKNLLSYVPH